MLPLMLLPCAVRAAWASLPSAPVPAFADTEAETNAVVCVAGIDGNRFRVSLELDAATNNCVLVEFGRDADDDGALGREEVALFIGWSAGRWVCRDRTGGGFASSERPSGHRRLGWTVALGPDWSARSLVVEDGGEAVFSGVVPASFFDSSWDMARIVRRGAAAGESVGYGHFTAPVRIIMR